MFNTMYSFWLNKLNNNSLNFSLNLWYIDSINSFNLLSSSTLSYIIYNINSPKVNFIKTISSTVNFDHIIIYFTLIIIPLLLMWYLIIL